MKVVKILERKEIIRFFGLALLLAPLVNTVASMAVRPDSANKWTTQTFLKMISTGGLPDHLLYLFSIFIGLIMLSGSSKTWTAVLVLLGGHLTRQVAELGENIRTHWIYGLFFLFNLVVFIFILDQLVWKQKSNSVAKPETPPAPKPRLALQRSKRILVHFQGLGPWAQLVAVESKGIRVRALMDPPEGLSTREVEFTLASGLNLRALLSEQKDREYFFAYTQLSSNSIQQLNQWLQKQAA